MADEVSNAAAAPAQDTAASVQPAATASPLVAMGDENPPEDWSPPQSDENGIAIDGEGLPLNLRLRALALSDKGLTEDPSGAVDADAIADAGKRAAAYEKDYPPLEGMTKAQLEAEAERASVDLSSATNNDERKAAISAARPVLV